MAQGAPPVLLYDAAGAPVSSDWAPLSGRPAQATYSTMGGITALGHDYATSASAGTSYAPKIDAQGSQYVVPTGPSGSPIIFTGNQALASQSSTAGPMMQALQGLTVTPVAIDGVGNVQAAPVALPTFTVLASLIATTSARSLLAIYNGSTTGKIIRLVRVYTQNSSTSAAALTAYQYVAFDLRAFTGLSGGTALTPLAYDSADAVDPGFKFATGASITGEITTPYRRWWSSNEGAPPGTTNAEGSTADQQGRNAWIDRTDPSSKLITIRPGQGVHLKVVSSSNQGQCDTTFIFTQASA